MSQSKVPEHPATRRATLRTSLASHGYHSVENVAPQYCLNDMLMTTYFQILSGDMQRASSDVLHLIHSRHMALDYKCVLLHFWIRN